MAKKVYTLSKSDLCALIDVAAYIGAKAALLTVRTGKAQRPAPDSELARIRVRLAEYNVRERRRKADKKPLGIPRKK